MKHLTWLMVTSLGDQLVPMTTSVPKMASSRLSQDGPQKTTLVCWPGRTSWSQSISQDVTRSSPWSSNPSKMSTGLALGTTTSFFRFFPWMTLSRMRSRTLATVASSMGRRSSQARMVSSIRPKKAPLVDRSILQKECLGFTRPLVESMSVASTSWLK